MTGTDLLRLMGRLGAKLYDPEILALVLETAKRIRDGENVKKEELPWPLSLY